MAKHDQGEVPTVLSLGLAGHCHSVIGGHPQYYQGCCRSTCQCCSVSSKLLSQEFVPGGQDGPVKSTALIEVAAELAAASKAEDTHSSVASAQQRHLLEIQGARREEWSVCLVQGQRTQVKAINQNS